MIPDHETVKQIMNDVYNGFYLKWRKQLTQENAGEMMQEYRELNQRYPYELCYVNLLNLLECIENEFRRRVPSE
jgi:hypothetical protein